ncbi:MAG: LamG domain-containing protein, partial [Candidatus Nanohaloarchaea archaeon]|nr:LamG domain-containing protein [Candidatus Nanohaloarchaea archaeon]
ALYHAPTAGWQTDLVEVRARGSLPAPYQRTGSFAFEATGQTVVDGAGQRSGVLGRNASVATDDPARVEGVSGQALQFDGRNDMVDDIDRTFTGPHTVSFWFRTDEQEGTDKKGILGTTNYENLVSVQDEYDNIIWWTDTNNNGIHASIDKNTWYHGAVVYDGSTRKLYINGNKVDSVSESRASFSYTRIGSNVHGSFNGTIDEVSFYRTALSTAQINDLLQIGQFTAPLHNASGSRFQVAAENPLGTAFDPEHFQYQVSTLTGDSTSLVRLDTVETATVSSWSQWTSNASVLDLPDSRWIQLQLRLVGNATRAPLLDITRVKAAHGLINPEPDPGLTTFTNSSTEHAFNVSTPVTDLNGAKDVTGCTVFATEPDGTTASFTGTIDENVGGVTDARCQFSRIDSTLSGFQPLERINVTVQFTDTASNQVNATTASNTIPNRPPKIVDMTRFPLVPELNDDVTLRIEANDTEETTVYANFTVKEDSTTIIDNVNGTSYDSPDGKYWNSTEFTLDDKNATYSMTVVVSDRWSTTKKTVLLSLDARPPNVTDVATRIPKPWNLPATHFRPGDDIQVRATVTDINTAANLDRYYFNVTSPRGRVAAFQPLSETASIFNGHNLSGRYETVETMATGIWNITVVAVDDQGLMEANTTSFTMQRFDNTTLGMNYSIDQSTAYVDDETVSSTAIRTDLTFPYFVAEGSEVLAGVVNYGEFQQLTYKTSDDSYQANMTQRYGTNRYLVPVAKISLFELEQLEDAFTGGLLDGRNFLQSTTSSFIGGRSNEKHVEVTLSYRNRPNIELTGFTGQLAGIQTLVIQRGPLTNETIHVRLTR